jgi:hypothetical protein
MSKLKTTDTTKHLKSAKVGTNGKARIVRECSTSELNT